MIQPPERVIDEVLRAIEGARAPRRMSTLIVAIDGFGGAGKCTLAAMIGERLGVPLLHTDDFATADNPLNWWPRLVEQVLEPLGQERAARYQRYDWPSERLAEWHCLEPGGILLLEGVSSSRTEFRRYLGFAVWVETPATERLRRGLLRDSDSDEVRAQWRQWMAAEDDWGNADQPWSRADLIISGVA